MRIWYCSGPNNYQDCFGGTPYKTHGVIFPREAILVPAYVVWWRHRVLQRGYSPVAIANCRLAVSFCELDKEHVHIGVTMKGAVLRVVIPSARISRNVGPKGSEG